MRRAAVLALAAALAVTACSDDGDADTASGSDANDAPTSTAEASVCRVFAPVYRSITLAGLGGAASPEARDIAYGDVLDAWQTYVDELGDGSGVVLIGHSQGAGHLTRLLEAESGRPEVAARIVSAVLLGSGVAEGSLPGLPNCTSADEAGCLISYASYPADQPPVENAIFGRVRGGGPAVCVDPVALAGGNGLGDTVLPTAFTLLGGVEGIGALDTPYIGLPGAVRTECVTTGD